MQLDGGGIDADWLLVKPNGTMDITGEGYLVYTSFADSGTGATIEDVIANGYITVDGGAGTVFVDTNSIPDRTILTGKLPDPEIIGWSISNDVMRLVVNAADSWLEYYYPEATADLTAGSWGSVPHSTNGLAPFSVANLDYSATDTTGTNEVIYVQVDDIAEFFKISSE